MLFVTAIPSPPTAPLETRVITANSVVLAWGIPETDGGSPVKGYVIAIKDKSKKMWMEVGKVKADVQKLTVKDLQVSLVAIFFLINETIDTICTRPFTVNTDHFVNQDYCQGASLI